MVTKVLLDSNILMDLMNEIEAAANEVEYYDDVAISAVTWVEVATGLDAAACLNFEINRRTSKIKVIHTDDAIMRESVAIRQGGLAQIPKKKIRSSDSIIGATANVEGRTVITRNARDFTFSKVRVPYDCEWDATTKIGTVTNIRPAP